MSKRTFYIRHVFEIKNHKPQRLSDKKYKPSSSHFTANESNIVMSAKKAASMFRRKKIPKNSVIAVSEARSKNYKFYRVSWKKIDKPIVRTAPDGTTYEINYENTATAIDSNDALYSKLLQEVEKLH